MAGFLTAVREYSFMQHALLAAVLVGAACGVVGTYVVVRRITFIADAIAHSVLGGIGAAVYLRKVYHWDFLDPLYGALVAGLLAAMIIGLVSLRAKQREDTVIGGIWAIGMAVGVLFIARTPGYNEDLVSYLFGNILMVSGHDLWLVAALDALVLGLGVLFYSQFLAVCFDEESARVRGIPVEFFYLLLLALTALTVVLLVTVVGVVLVIALLTLPVAVASYFSKNLWQMMAISILATMVFSTAGLALSYRTDLPTGATIVVLAGTVYLALTAVASVYHQRRARTARAGPGASLTAD
jgi:zinc transport system permease protein